MIYPKKKWWIFPVRFLLTLTRPGKYHNCFKNPDGFIHGDDFTTHPCPKNALFIDEKIALLCCEEDFQFGLITIDHNHIKIHEVWGSTPLTNSVDILLAMDPN